jgi:4-amino-4-deoxy-L-arabinose transferase-like glycosyltransferase
MQTEIRFMTARLGFFIVIFVTLWRIITLHFDTTDLFVDEAQYWFWSQNLDLGYYSKPPMIAWVIRAMTGLAGSNGIFWIRLSGPLIHMATALVLMKIAKRFVSPDIEGWTGATYITLPGVALSSVFFSTDVVLLFFLAVALFAYFGLTRRPSHRAGAVDGRCLRLRVPFEIRHPVRRSRRVDRTGPAADSADFLARLLHLGGRGNRRRPAEPVVERHP